MEEFLAREPSAEQRIEVAIARLCELVTAAWMKGPRQTVRDFLPYLNAWDTPVVEGTRYSDLDREVLASVGIKVH